MTSAAANVHVLPESPWAKGLRRLKALAIDGMLLALFLLMVEFLALAFSGERGPTGLLLTSEEILARLHYGPLGVAALLGGLLWNLFYRELGASVGRVMTRGVPPDEAELPWTRTLRGWFGALLVELTFFTGWILTEVELVTFLTKFNKASDMIRGLASPSSAVLAEGLVLLVQTIFLAFMATAFAIPVAFVLSFLAARNLTRGSFGLRLSYTVVRALMNFTRAVEPLVWALIFISWVGIGPFAGVLALWVHSVASLAKLYAQAVKSLDDKGSREPKTVKLRKKLAEEFMELKPRIFRIVEAQKRLAMDLLNDAKRKIAAGDKVEGGLSLFRVFRGVPKYKPLIKYLSEPGIIHS